MEKTQAQTFNQDPSRYREDRVCKEIFERVRELLIEKGVRSVLDIGCANGDFLYCLPDHIKGQGVDISEEFIRIASARNKKPNLNFETIDILSSQAAKLVGKFEAVTLIGVLSTFHDVEKLLDKILALNPKYLFIHSPLHEAPVDAMHFHRDLTRPGSDFQCAYNIFSKQTISALLNNRGIKKFKFVPFEMNKTLVKDEKNPIYNYHVTLENKERYLTNGIGILFKEYILVIDRT